MPATHLCLHFHVIFSTSNREPWLGLDWRDSLHAYMGGIIRDLNGVPVAVGGMADHAHLLLGLRATHVLADVMREVKRGSSKWIHECRGRAGFAWQEGYGGFTVSPDRVEAVRRYIERQPEHHRNKTFQEEYLELLKEAGIAYDEAHLW